MSHLSQIETPTVRALPPPLVAKAAAEPIEQAKGKKIAI
jgi:hypothetical protein